MLNINIQIYILDSTDFFIYQTYKERHHWATVSGSGLETKDTAAIKMIGSYLSAALAFNIEQAPESHFIWPSAI